MNESWTNEAQQKKIAEKLGGCEQKPRIYMNLH